MTNLDQLLKQIDMVADKHQLSHAYLIVGANPINNQLIAQHLAGLFLDLDQAITDQYPDLVQIGLDNKPIKIDEIRQVLDILSRKSINGRGRILEIFNANNLNTFSYNALLKSIEEPANDQLIILTTAFLNQIPETIVSRLQILRLETSDQESDQAKIPAVDQWVEALTNQDPKAFALVQLALVNDLDDQEILINQIIDAFAQLANQNIENQKYLQALEIVLRIEELLKSNVSLQNSLEYATVKIEEVFHG